MRGFRNRLAVMCVAVLAIGMLLAVDASASQFTWSEVGTLSGTQTTNQVFTASSGGPEVVCKAAATSGELTSKAFEAQEVTVNYSSCSIPALFGAAVSNFKAAYNLHANGKVNITGTITIAAPALGCTTIVSEQEVGNVSFATSGSGILQSSAVTGIHSTSTGLCPSGTTGTYTGSNLWTRVGGGTISFDP
jgi:hypothetical protein